VVGTRDDAWRGADWYRRKGFVQIVNPA
jgi:hypothetical protein